MDNRRLTVGSLKENTVKPLTNNFKNEKKSTKKDIKRGVKSEKIDVVQNNRIYKIIPEANHTLLDTALNQKQKLSFKCKKGTCGQCMINVLRGMEYLEEPTNKEHKKLEAKVNKGYRLACQAMVK
ncbi:2Fe-2S iron-sulfur cluster-binding protein [Gracilibacillus sp. YIM 98692]|uniref:2Fe-2S iron-sulfur cluster-binding protein n=1 Tax=Gracilibacillus sp. YIM 98692 TaxID=2663532 RepID=UPI0013D166DF|nr:2Fe-2S iron-sulfur cluster-binding protein [Gracilibacillus sp. YIM 98692]